MQCRASLALTLSLVPRTLVRIRTSAELADTWQFDWSLSYWSDLSLKKCVLSTRPQTQYAKQGQGFRNTLLALRTTPSPQKKVDCWQSAHLWCFTLFEERQWQGIYIRGKVGTRISMEGQQGQQGKQRQQGQSGARGARWGKRGKVGQGGARRCNWWWDRILNSISSFNMQSIGFLFF